ncbi:hypothetical protein EM858_23610 [Agrobacterium sp. CNPSo 2736]|uniref:hypothetical protein n=1 Tax=Agrobacterium sp. CNPSo 2736 TaxID=2499627 RepID=UPI000FDB1D0F|nr:hypothetical protein [Agrobacterium sp. CNPSo 2736]RVT71062.1 hypothetical protein EM858_23610 [Agrobacterium sp. CNPSo 2736]
MITNVPTSVEFIERADSLLHLSYSIVSKLYDNQSSDWASHADDELLRDYWEKCAPSLANALALLQQAHELYLKGKIAEVSPYLLLARDPQQWPKGSISKDVSFSEFLTVGASELPRLHDMVCSPRLDDETKTFLNSFRERRNMFVHQGHAPTSSAAELFFAVLKTHKWAHPSIHWFDARDSHLSNDHLSTLFDTDHVMSNLHGEFSELMKELTPSAFKDVLGFNKKGRWYFCPHCKLQMGDFSDSARATAQLGIDKKTPTAKCLVCSKEIQVLRRKCRDPNCKSTVYAVASTEWDEHCMECGADDDFANREKSEGPIFALADPFSWTTKADDSGSEG